MNQNHIHRRRERRPLARLLAVGVIGVSLAACDTKKLLEVSDPAVVTPEGATSAAAAQSLFFGAIRDFTGAYSGLGDDAYVISSGLLADELYNGDTFTTRIAIDQRNQQAPQFGNVQDAAYSRLHRARFSARRAAYIVKSATPDSAQKYGELRALEGYTYTTLAEGWCGNVPFSTLPDSGAIDPLDIKFNRGLTTDEMLDSALVRFDDAINGISAADTRPAFQQARRLALVGKARTLLDRNQPAAAAALVTELAVPNAFVYRLEHSPNAGNQNNPIFSLINNGRYGVSNLEGATTLNAAGNVNFFRPDSAVLAVSRPSAEGIAFRGLQDPRVPWTGPFTAFSGSFRKYFDMNNPNLDADVPLASGAEARLIQAEAQMRAGNFAGPGGTLSILNFLRANAAPATVGLHPQQTQTFSTTLPALADPGTATARENLFFQERALWLYNTGHRLGDLRRLVRQYGRASNTVFPSGPFYRGGSYGNDVNFSVRFEEQNNPSYVPSQCVTTQA